MIANNMTNKELLVLAAKAANYDVVEDSDGGLPFTVKADNEYFTWNPLTSDGDALRLAVKLDIPISPESVNGTTWICRNDMPQVFESHNNAPCAATRRAIVRAAATIASNLNKE